MPQKVIRFSGINRIIPEYHNSGACEELINLRPTELGASVVKNKKVMAYSLNRFKTIVRHEFGSTENFLAIAYNLVYWITLSGEIKQTVTTGDVESISSAGNVILVNFSDGTNKAFKFKDGTYTSYEVSIKPIKKAYINYAYSADTLVARSTVVAESASAASYNAALQKAASIFHTSYPDGLCGSAVVGCTYELEDGTEVWSTAFVVANSARCANYIEPSIDTDTLTVAVTGARKVSLKLEFDGTSAAGIKKINVYASRPVFQYNVQGYGIGTASPTYSVEEQTLEESGLGGQIMYYQGSVDPSQSTASLTLHFNSAQAGERIMDVTAGCITRSGSTVSYNNRFHFYNSDVDHIIQVPTVSMATENRVTTSEYWVAYVLINGSWKLADCIYRFSSSLPNDFIYPMAGVKRLAFVEAEYDTNGDFTVLDENMFYVDLVDSGSYNYSYAFDVTPSLVQTGSFLDDVQQWGEVPDASVFWKEETNAINVSAQFNPFVFPVEYSYSFDGEIIDVATSYLPISSTQVGQYPLSVFTTAGIYALEQGNGAVLYSNITPLQPLVIEGKATTTPYGTFFISSKSLYLLSGRDQVNVSQVLNGGRELYIRELDSYKKLCCGESSVFYDFSSLLSGVDFEDFVGDVSLAYDQLQNELYISSNDSSIPYSYVFNLNTKAFHKAARKYLNVQSGSRYVIETIGSSLNIVDLFTEEKGEQAILLQSRPMSLDMLYSHIHRLLLLADAELTGDQYLCLSVFASDNLNDWKCIISSQKHDVAFRQIRTNRAAKSYKDYIILITGMVDTDTDISDLIADYTVVNRRLG